MYKKITETKNGTVGKIVEIKDSDIRIHLLEMGCVEGEIIEVKKTSILGGPISIRVGSYTLSLRKKEAENIVIDCL